VQGLGDVSRLVKLGLSRRPDQGQVVHIDHVEPVGEGIGTDVLHRHAGRPDQGEPALFDLVHLALQLEVVLLCQLPALDALAADLGHHGADAAEQLGGLGLQGEESHPQCLRLGIGHGQRQRGLSVRWVAAQHHKVSALRRQPLVQEV